MLLEASGMARKEIGMRIAELRDRKGLTQERLSERADVSRSYLADIEAGHRKNPSLAVLTRIADALGMGVGELLKGAAR